MLKVKLLIRGTPKSKRKESLQSIELGIIDDLEFENARSEVCDRFERIAQNIVGEIFSKHKLCCEIGFFKFDAFGDIERVSFFPDFTQLILLQGRLKMTSEQLQKLQNYLTKTLIREIQDASCDFKKCIKLLKQIESLDIDRRDAWDTEKFGAYNDIADKMFTTDDIPF